MKICNKGNLFNIHRRMNNIGSRAKFTWTLLRFTDFARDTMTSVNVYKYLYILNNIFVYNVLNETTRDVRNELLISIWRLQISS